jgi:hypothetical protein
VLRVFAQHFFLVSTGTVSTVQYIFKFVHILFLFLVISQGLLDTSVALKTCSAIFLQNKKINRIFSSFFFVSGSNISIVRNVLSKNYSQMLYPEEAME